MKYKFLLLFLPAMLVFSALRTTAVFADDALPPDSPAVEETQPGDSGSEAAPPAEETQPGDSGSEVAPPAVEETQPGDSGSEVAPPAEETQLGDSGSEAAPPAAETPGEGQSAFESNVEETLPVSESPAVEAPQTEGISAALANLPEDAGILVLDETGQAVPLASREAAEIIAASDPYFRDSSLNGGAGGYIGYSPTGTCPPIVDICHPFSLSPIQDAVNAFALNPNATAAIFVVEGTYSENVIIDTVPNLAGLIGAGSGNTFITGNVTVANMNGFLFQGFTLNGGFSASGNSGELTLRDLSVTNPAGSGIAVTHTGNVTLENVTANGNGNTGTGIMVETTGDITAASLTASENDGNGAELRASGSVTLTGNNVFNGNRRTGLLVSSPDINLSDVTAIGNEVGIRLDGYDNAVVNNNCRSVSDNGTGVVYGGSHPGSPLTLNGILFNNNGFDLAGKGNVQLHEGCGGSEDGGSGGGKSSPVKVKPWQAVIQTVETQSATPDCSIYAGVIFVLPNGDKATFFCEVKGEVFAEGGVESKLPASLPFGTFVSMLNAEGSASAFKVSFLLPEDTGAEFAILHWNGSEWVEVKGSRAGNAFEATGNFTGTFVLVKK